MPPPPEKQAVGRFSSEFIESRRRALEKFMSRILAHPSLSQSEAIVTFLEADDAGLTSARDRGKAEKSQKAPSVMSWFETKVNAMTVQPNEAAMERTAADMKIEEITEYINKLEAHMTTLTKHVASLLKRQREMAAAMRDFGQAYTYFGQAEGDALGTALIQVGTCSEELAVANSDGVEMSISGFEEPLLEYVRILGSVKAALSRRESKKQTYYNALIDLDAKLAAYNRALGIPGKEDSANQKQLKVEEAQSHLDRSKDEYEKVSRILMDEFEMFKSIKAIELRDIAMTFVKLQGEVAAKSERAWQDLSDRLGSSEFSPPAAPPSMSGAKDVIDSFPAPGAGNATAGNPFAASNFREEDDEMIGV